MKFYATLVLMCAVAWPAMTTAADEPLSFAAPHLQLRYEHLLEELRCLVCQNQTLADSHAELAQDLRSEVHRMLDEGLSNDAILEFMVQRYGDFVLYRPPLKVSTWLLWLGPLIAFAAALVAIVRHARKRQRPAQELDATERERLDRLLADHQRES
jgi:cytochrome c-type biogenesis protein CcmH